MPPRTRKLATALRRRSRSPAQGHTAARSLHKGHNVSSGSPRAWRDAVSLRSLSHQNIQCGRSTGWKKKSAVDGSALVPACVSAQAAATSGRSYCVCSEFDQLGEEE